MVESGISPTLATLVLGLIGSALSYLAIRLNRHGQHEEIKQKQLADRVTERSQAFDELESVNARLREENDRLRLNADRQYTNSERLRKEQFRVCKAQLEAIIGVMATLQSVVLSEVAAVASRRNMGAALEHMSSHEQETQSET